jgi:sulfate-transporting ATPase
MIGFGNALILGLGLAGIYTLIAQGLVLTYRGSGVVNFAHGAFVMVGAYVFYQTAADGWPTALAIIAAVLAGAVLGLATQFAVMRPLRHAAPIVRTMATLGVFLTLLAVGGLRYGDSVSFAQPFLPQGHWHLGRLTIAVNGVLLFGLAALLTAVLMYMKRRSLVGLATTAAAESERSASTLGWSPALLATLNWVIGGALAGLAGALITPLTALTVQALAMLVVPALAAALLGRFDSFGLTLLGALLVAVLQSVSIRYISLTGAEDSIPFLVILVVLTISGRGLPIRGEAGNKLPSIGSGRIRLVPLVVFSALGLLSLWVFGLTWGDAFDVWTSTAIVLLSLVVLTGYAGQISLAQLAIGGIGAWVAGRLVAAHGWPFELALVAGIVVAVPVGTLFALPALRTRGVNLAVLTFGMAFVVEQMLFNNVNYTGGTQGTQVGTTKIFGIDVSAVDHPQRYGVVLLIALILASVLVANLRSSAAGRRLVAIRGSERGAASLGISVVRGKLYAFSVAAGIAALGGTLLGFQSASIIYNQTFDVVSGIQQLALAVIGGLGYVLGPLFGSVLASGSLGSLTSPLFASINVYLPLIGAVGMVLMVVIHPDGQAPLMAQRGKALAARVGTLVRRPAARRREHRAERDLQHALALIQEVRGRGVSPAHPKELEVRDLRIEYGGIVAVDRVGFSVKPGQVIGLIGPNGAGKTSLIDAITGFASVKSGTVLLGGADITNMAPHLRAHRGLVRSWQSLELFEDISVLENLLVACDRLRWWHNLTDLVKPGRVRLSPIAAAAVDEFREFGLSDDLYRRTGELSFSQRRLVATARAVAYGPSVLLLDEPTAGMSDVRRREVSKVVRRLAEEWGMSVVLVDHDMPFVMDVCDEIVVMDAGRKIAQGTPDAIRSDPLVIAAYLRTEDNEQPCAEQAATPAQTAKHAGLPVTAASGAAKEPQGTDIRRPADVLLEARDIEAGYSGTPVLRGLNFDVRAGELVALLGANRAGKTTTLLTLAGELHPLGGDVHWLGSRVTDRVPLHTRARQGLGFVTDERSVFMQLTVRENIRLGRCDTDLVLDLFPELKPLLGRRTGLLSGGEQQMLGLGRALARQPKLLMVDEMSLGLAPIIVSRLLQALRRAADEHRVGVILIEQHVEQALAVADRVCVIAGGRMTLEGAVADVGHQVEEAFLSGVLGISSPSGKPRAVVQP